MLRVFLLIQLLLASSECHGDCEETALLQSDGKGRPIRRRHYGSEQYDLPTLSETDIETIKGNCYAGVANVTTGLRFGGGKVVMQIVIMPRAKPSDFTGLWDVGADKDDSSLLGSRDIARAKAFTALGFSSNQNALSSRGIGVLEGVPIKEGGLPGIHNTNRQANAGIVLFGGGLPLYNNKGQLVGGVGVSGDGVLQDEAVALACATGFEPPSQIITLPLVNETVINPLK